MNKPSGINISDAIQTTSVTDNTIPKITNPMLIPMIIPKTDDSNRKFNFSTLIEKCCVIIDTRTTIIQ